MTRYAVAFLCAVVPLYGTFAALAPERPPIPPLLPRGLTIVVALLVLAALVAVVPAGWRAARRDWLTFGFLGGGVATLVSGLVGFDPPSGVGLGVLVIGQGFAGLALSRSDPATVRLCTRSFLWSALLAGLVALSLLALRHPVALYAYNNGRAVGTFLNPNELAAYTLVALGCAVPLAVVSRGRDRLALAVSLVAAVTLAATFSRWGAFSAVCGVAVYALATRARRLLVAALAVALLAFALDTAVGTLHHNPRDTEARAVAWRTGWSTFARFPLLGVGPLAYAKTYDVLRSPDAPGPRTPVAFDPHSLALSFAADGGLVAVVTLTISVVVLQRRIFAQTRTARGPARALALGLAAGLVALYVDSAINTISIFFPLGYQSVALALGATRGDDA